MYFFFLKIFDLAFKHAWNKYISLLGAGLYGLHTANAETVNYIIARSDLISTLMIILGFVLYLYSNFCRKYYIYLVPVIIGMLTKETTITFALLLLTYIVLFENKISLYELFSQKHFSIVKKSIIKSLPSFIVCIFLAWFSIKMISSTYTPGGYSRINYLITQPFVMLHYFNSFFFPFNLSVDTDWTPITNFFDDRVIVGIVFIAIMLFISFKASVKESYKPIAFGILWFFIALLPTSSIIPLSEVMNDHRTFFPYVGLMISISWCIGILLINNEKKILKSKIYKKLIVTSITILFISHAYGTYQRNKVWATDESLWYDCTLKSPNNGRGLMNYGLTQMSKGKYDVALNYFEKALIFNPYYSILHVNLGIVKNVIGKTTEAEQHFKNAINYGQYQHETYYYYANFLNEHNRKAEAIDLLKKSIQISPQYMFSRYLLMSIYNDLGLWNDLNNLVKETLSIYPNDNTSLSYLNISKNKKSKIELAEETAAKNPKPENYLNLSLLYYQAGNYKGCIEACQKALKINPQYADAYNNICSAYNAMGEWNKAIEACEKAISIKPDFQLAINNLNYAKEMKNQK
jgi:tetratricopeptide (TPR) repeat protein